MEYLDEVMTHQFRTMAVHNARRQQAEEREMLRARYDQLLHRMLGPRHQRLPIQSELMLAGLVGFMIALILT